MGIRSDWPQLASILNKGLASLSVEEIDAIYRKWLIAPEQKQLITLNAEEQAWLAAHPDITLGSGIYPPWDFIDEATGQPEGIAPDYINLIGSKLGITFKYISDDFSKIHQMARKKNRWYPRVDKEG